MSFSEASARVLFMADARRCFRGQGGGELVLPSAGKRILAAGLGDVGPRTALSNTEPAVPCGYEALAMWPV